MRKIAIANTDKIADAVAKYAKKNNLGMDQEGELYGVLVQKLSGEQNVKIPSYLRKHVDALYGELRVASTEFDDLRTV